MENRVSANLSQADKDAVMAALATIKAKLPFLIDIPAEERKTMLKMGDKSRTFVQKTMELVNQNDGFLPRAFEVEEMRKDVQLLNDLYPMLQAVNQLQELIDDTVMVVGSEAYAAALVVYRYAKDSGLGAGLDGVVDDIGRRFARKSKKAEELPKV
ncbi:hypothetical protein Syn7502_03532 [Synechococcus sp. PCC 7502]|uniref:hypothetical protein n=1 Tax=Synechococcus sp. PCC 7502 TaxID=1173263 RepID=UPI00029FA493|nr:hypothetical protein [Synechococcus sp. PCC 7502]AFY75371.1 hypothetical protein Syn7502_03532 [Synechococcus sp. PCC 7502]